MPSTESQQSPAAAPGDREPYPRTNWWGEDFDDDDEEEEHSPGNWETTWDPNDPGMFRAHDIRKGRFNPVCGACYERGKVINLTRPTEHIGDTAGDLRHARRYNPETGHMNWDNGTWTRIPDGTLDELLADVEIWAGMHNSACDSGNEIDEELLEELQQLARRQKKQQNSLSDTEILANVVKKARMEGAVE